LSPGAHRCGRLPCGRAGAILVQIPIGGCPLDSGACMDLVSTFIPPDRRAALARAAGLPDRAEGTVLFADISGFTPLAEAFATALGPQHGAEAITTHLDRVFEALIGELDRYGGSVVGFSGDALTAWFDGDQGRA